MFDSEARKLYEELQQKLKSNSEIALNNISQEISYTRNHIISRINDMIIHDGIKIEPNLIENIVDETLMEDLKTSNKNTLFENYRTLYQFNDAMRAVIIQQAKEQKSKDIKQEQLKLVMDKFDYVMTAYKETKINLLEQYNHLFQTILRKTPLYTSPELVKDIKIYLSREKDSMERSIQSERNRIIASNLNVLMDTNAYLVKQTNLVSNEISPTTEEVQSEVKKAEEKVEERISKSNEHLKQAEVINESVNEQQNISYQQVEAFEYEKNIDSKVQSPQQEEEYKTLYAPNFRSSESYTMEETPQSTKEQNYRILDDGTIEWLKPQNIDPTPKEHRQIDSIPSKVDSETMLINIVKENIKENLWNEIGIIASNTDNTINIISNQITTEAQMILQKYGITDNRMVTQKIIEQFDHELKEINNNLSANMIKSFTKINNDTMSSISQTFSKPEEIRNQDVEQCVEVYKKSTSLANFRLTCQKQFEQCMGKLCYQYNISKNTNVYNELFRTFENKRVQMESQFYNMYLSFSNSNSMFIEKSIGSTMLS